MFNNTVDLGRLPLSWKMLFTGFVLILGIGYLSAVINATLSVGLSVEAIADHYGDKSLNKEEAAIMEKQGFVEEEFSLDDEEDDMNMDSMDMEHDASAMQHDMSTMGHDMGAMDHDMGGMDHMMGDDSLPPQIFAQVSHIHLLSFSLLLLAIGGLTCLTRLSEGVKTALVTTLFLAFLSDIAGLSLTRFVSDNFAWMTMIAGITVGVCLAFMILRILWELWGPRPSH